MTLIHTTRCRARELDDMDSARPDCASHDGQARESDEKAACCLALAGMGPHDDALG